MMAEEQERKRKDVRKDGTRKVKRNKRELIKMLQERGITATGKAEDIKRKRIAENNGILTEIEEQIIEEGWEGKPKGMLQILWE
jgi:hypothetical protein